MACRLCAMVVIGAALGLAAQAQTQATSWRGAGPVPCVGSDGGAYKCPPPARAMAVRAGRLLDTKTGRMSTGQVVLLSGDRITEVGPESQVKIPSGVEV